MADAESETIAQIMALQASTLGVRNFRTKFIGLTALLPNTSESVKLRWYRLGLRNSMPKIQNLIWKKGDLTFEDWIEATMNYEDWEEIAAGDRLVEAQKKMIARTEKNFR